MHLQAKAWCARDDRVWRLFSWPQVQELDVHCLIHVADLARLWRCVLGAPSTTQAEVVGQLAGWSLDLSCTVMGVCIYRIARKQTAPGASPRELESAVHRLCQGVHAVLAELPA